MTGLQASSFFRADGDSSGTCIEEGLGLGRNGFVSEVNKG